MGESNRKESQEGGVTIPKKRKHKQPTIPREERLKLYAPLMTQGMGYKKIAKATGIPLGTVKWDFHNMRIPTPPIVQGDGKTPTPLQPLSKDLDWQKQADNLGRFMLNFVKESIQKGNSKDAMNWMNTYFRAMSAKFGTLRVTQNINVDNRQIHFHELDLDNQKEVTREILQKLLDDNKESEVCPLCKRKKER